MLRWRATRRTGTRKNAACLNLSHTVGLGVRRPISLRKAKLNTDSVWSSRMLITCAEYRSQGDSKASLRTRGRILL